MLHSIATVSLSGTLLEKTRAIANAGYDGIELFENDLTISTVSPTDYRNLLAELGLELVGLQPFRDYEAMPEPFKTRSLDRAKRKFELMHQLDTETLFICSNTSPHTIDSLEKAAEDLYDMAELARQHGFRIGYEALSWGRHVNTYHQSVEIVRRANHPNLGNILDNFHISALNSTFEDIYTIPAHKLTIVQMADAPRFDMGAMHLGRHYRCFPGQGSFPVVEFLKAVQSTGYDGYLSHEIFSDEFRSSAIEPVAVDGKRSLIWLEQTLNQTPKPDLQRLEFVEFTTTPDAQPDLIDLLANLGFAETFRHRTKAVSLWQCGQVTVVLNRQADDYAPNTVCAIGFRTPDKQAVAQRAKQLRYDWQERSRSPNELDMPASRGIGGMLYYFIDESAGNAIYDLEFDPTGHTPTGPDALRFDHIGHTVGHDAYLSNTLYYRTLLGLSVDESLELLDPRGIVYSRVAANGSGSIRIPLSSSRSQGTSSDQFVARSGSGIQQIAWHTDDIFGLVASVRNKDLILPIPANYYDDLQAKTDLPDAQIAAMQAHNILYDRNESGVFFHVYFKEINGLFIEIVHRQGSYSRFGEINAQVRLAAQARTRT
ncbi:bifunctional sugar phosphate isomerase/epimerase/4-hydroxyphenylpyruvate dioxygenase family protein [Spirosoma rhododendri]|uniref:3-dehydroshikimate dehydratase n=1 Tax=Spirosoma rhododendri TaxID=2728024 RepID=A0A7L5DVJ6_9BACT|nr:sugar phosphate isomerase/epimerase and 4-hydroxyphenylpyruvate domain-containing protein [Spirosoma rhododendri]QJD79987.1 sugar phosphate isomerase/epimerase and 4-hydroxyphenylpyruvate domain-containing protein [Spirosoma rhododendri]